MSESNLPDKPGLWRRTRDGRSQWFCFDFNGTQLRDTLYDLEPQNLHVPGCSVWDGPYPVPPLPQKPVEPKVSTIDDAIAKVDKLYRSVSHECANDTHVKVSDIGPRFKVLADAIKVLLAEVADIKYRRDY